MNRPDVKSFYIPFATLSAILVAFTFPDLNPVYSPGLDPPLAWVFNFTFSSGNHIGRDFLFPHGPLSFLLYPLPMGHNLFIAVAVYAALKIFLFWQLCRLTGTEKPSSWIAAFFLAYVFFVLFEIQFIMLAVVVAGFSLYLHTGNSKHAWVPVFVTAVAFYMRGYVAVTTGFALAGFLLILYLKQKQVSVLLRLIASWLGIVFLVWLGLFHSPFGFADFLAGRFVLSLDNSTAAALYPENNWWWLTASLAFLFLSMYLHKGNARWYALFFLPILFAQWKYSMARQDLIHSRGFVVMLILFFSFFLFHARSHRVTTLLLAAACIGSFYANLPNVYGYSEWNQRILQLNRFLDFTFHYSRLEEQWKKTSEENIRTNRLDSSMLARIGQHSVDCYPWDYTYIPANGLNWSPHPVLHSYAAYTSWLDKHDAEHFAGPDGPQFLIWHLAKEKTDPSGGSFESLDRRYELNDEPQTIKELLSHYALVTRTPSVLLLEKRPNALPLPVADKIPDTLRWNTWHDVPATGDWVRLDAHFHSTFGGSAKSFLYKGEAFSMVLQDDEGQVYCYRIVPKNAEDGLWISPLILHPEDQQPERHIRKILFTCTHVKLQQPAIPVEWEMHVPGGADNNSAFPASWFGKSTGADTVLLSSFNDIRQHVPGWDSWNLVADTANYFSAPASLRLEPGAFSSSFSCGLDSLCADAVTAGLEVHASLWAKSVAGSKGVLVISLEENGNLFFYQAGDFTTYATSEGQWKPVISNADLRSVLTGHKNVRLKIYAWNTGEVPVNIDDMRVIVRER